MIDLDSLGRRLAAAGFRPEAGTMAAVLAAVFALGALRALDATLRAIGAAAADLFPRYGMLQAARIAEFVAQTAHETGGYIRFEENLNYGASALARTWPARFAIDPQAEVKQPTAAALTLAHRPEDIANTVYARAAEGNVHPGDGWCYRGRGMLQLTFRGNYRAAGQRLGLDLEDHPELAADPARSLLIALDFWQRAAVNRCCDAGDWFGARGLTNCGTRTPKVAPIGLADVAERRERLLKVLAAPPPPREPCVDPGRSGRT